MKYVLDFTLMDVPSADDLERANEAVFAQPDVDELTHTIVTEYNTAKVSIVVDAAEGDQCWPTVDFVREHYRTGYGITVVSSTINAKV